MGGVPAGGIGELGTCSGEFGVYTYLYLPVIFLISILSSTSNLYVRTYTPLILYIIPTNVQNVINFITYPAIELPSRSRSRLFLHLSLFILPAGEE